jgi:uncharacterized protein (UPF0332 family)
MNEPDLLMEKAQRSIQAAERLLADGDADFAVSRTYYAYFYTAQALLATRGIDLSRHGQVIAQYGLHFSKTRALDPVFHNWFNKAFKLRQLADYQVEVPVDPEDVTDLLSGCRTFIVAASEYLEQLQGQSSDPKEPVTPG